MPGAMPGGMPGMPAPAAPPAQTQVNQAQRQDMLNQVSCTSVVFEG